MEAGFKQEEERYWELYGRERREEERREEEEEEEDERK